MRVIANSLPKSGTHLIGRVLQLAGFSESDIHFSSSLIRRTSKNPIKNIVRLNREGTFGQDLWIDLDYPRAIKMHSLQNILNGTPKSTYSEAHLPYSQELLSFFEHNNIKIIYIIRDPRDVIVSHFHHLKRDPNYYGNKLMSKSQNDNERLLRSIKGLYSGPEEYTASIGTRVRNSIGWYQLKSDSVLALRFEDLIGSKGGGDNDAQEASIIHLEDFLNLKRGAILDLRDGIFHTKAETFRKGIIGDWVNYLTPDLLEAVEHELGDLIRKLGY